MITESKFLTPLKVECLDDDKTWVLLTPLVYQSIILQGILTIPTGYKTDFSSVPRVPFVYWFFGGRAHHESVPHDFSYGTHLFSKKISDAVFLEAMKCRLKSGWIRYSMYWGVEFGGSSSYRNGLFKFKKQNPTITDEAIKKSFVPA